MNFKDLGLSEKTIKAIEELGIITPTTVQADVIPSVLEGKDIFTIAPSHCGKTCSYVFPLIDIISRRQGQNILVITADSENSVIVSDRFALINKYHENNEKKNAQKHEANVIIASPDLLLEIEAEGKLNLTTIQILVVDDINLIKKKHQLKNLEKVLEKLPADKQNIVFTNRRSKETQGILDKILKTPTEIKIDKDKEDEAVLMEKNSSQVSEKEAHTASAAQSLEKTAPQKEKAKLPENDPVAVQLAETYHVFGDKVPSFLLVKGELDRTEC